MNKSLKGEYRIIDERQYFAVKSGEVIVVVKYLVPKEEGDKKEDGTEQILGERRKRKALAAVAATTQDKK